MKKSKKSIASWKNLILLLIPVVVEILKTINSNS